MKKDHINISDAPIVRSEKFNRLIRFVYSIKYVYVRIFRYIYIFRFFHHQIDEAMEIGCLHEILVALGKSKRCSNKTSGFGNWWFGVVNDPIVGYNFNTN